MMVCLWGSIRRMERAQASPPSERGVARAWMGCPCQANDKRQGPRRGEYCGEPSHQGRFHTGNKRSKPFADASCSSMHRRQAAVLLPPPFSFAPKSQSRSIPSTGRHPPLSQLCFFDFLCSLFVCVMFMEYSPMLSMQSSWSFQMDDWDAWVSDTGRGDGRGYLTLEGRNHRFPLLVRDALDPFAEARIPPHQGVSDDMLLSRARSGKYPSCPAACLRTFAAMASM